MRISHKVSVGASVAVATLAAAVIGLPVLAQPVVASRSVIVVFEQSVQDPASTANEHAVKNGFLPSHKYGHVVKGYSAHLNGKQIAKVSADPRVAFVSEDREVQATAKPDRCSPWPSCKGGGEEPPPPPADPQETPTGVSRIGLASGTGAGVAVAVIDTGIQLNHPDLNVVAQKNCLHRRKPAKDDNGHGTHVAGTVAALDNSQGVVGVAPGADLVAVKVLNAQGSGTWSGVICGIDWVASNASALNIKVANLSLSGGGSSDDNCGSTNGDALHAAVCGARDAGVTLVVAAGNDAVNASTRVPAAYDDAVITVSALADSDGLAGGLGPNTDYGNYADDTFAGFSNWGSSVDIGAPGVDILSTVPGSGYSSDYSGTSMASPHVAGAVALYLAANPGASWSDALNALVASGEVLGAGHTDPSGMHPEPVLNLGSL